MTLDQEKQIFYLIQYDIRQILIKVFAKGLPEAKQQLLIKKSRSVGLNHCDDPNAFIEYSNDMEDIFEKYDEYNPNKKKYIDCIWWYDCWYVWQQKPSTNSNITFIRSRKISISLVFNTQFYFAAPKNIRLNSRYYFDMKIPHKGELQQTAINHPLDLDAKDFIKTNLTN